MQGFLRAGVADYMTSNVLTLSPETPLREIERLFSLNDFNGFPVVEQEQLTGMVTKFDVLKVFVFTPRAVIPPYEELSHTTAAQIMTRNVITFTPEAPLTRILQTLVDFRVKSFPVLDGHRLAGIIAREDVVRALHELVGSA
jgi:CBS domain-containing protein